MPRPRWVIHARDDTGVVVDWLLKVVMLIAMVGILLVETVGILLARYNAAEGASSAASQAALVLRTTAGTGEGPEVQARASAEERGCTLVSMRLDPQAATVLVTVEKKARTFFIHKFEPFEGLLVARASADASYRAN